MGFFGGQTKPDVQLEELQPALPELPKRKDDTVIAEGLTICGDLHGSGVVQVQGTVEGEIRLSGAVTVAPTGLVKGPIRADVVQVAGRVEGDITANKHLRLEKTGAINGNIATVSFVIEDGGRLNGCSTMAEPAQSGDGDF